jgi:hypothetical protein
VDVPPWQGKFIFQKFIKKLKVISFHQNKTAVKTIPTIKGKLD